MNWNLPHSSSSHPAPELAEWDFVRLVDVVDILGYKGGFFCLVEQQGNSTSNCPDFPSSVTSLAQMWGWQEKKIYICEGMTEGRVMRYWQMRYWEGTLSCEGEEGLGWSSQRS